jgi:putative cell wall-binding protein
MPVKTRTKKSTGGRRGKQNRKTTPVRKWSRSVMETSDALDLQPGIFKAQDPKRIARSLKRSAEKSTRRKGTPYQSAMSMLSFYINRAGRLLSAKQKKLLERAKQELLVLFKRA